MPEIQTMKHTYDSICHDYRERREADSRIVDRIIELLDLPLDSVVAEIGAGTGNYTLALAQRGFRVKAIEPSEVMRTQIAPHQDVDSLAGVAENIPLCSHCVDGVFSILALHHFTSPSRAFEEAGRVCAVGPILFFTKDPRKATQYWFDDYFPTLWTTSHETFPPIDKVAQLLGEKTARSVSTHVFELPRDLSDSFAASAWHQPELCLDPVFRGCNSCFVLADQQAVEDGLAHLKRDLDSGAWDYRWGHLREMECADLGFRFLIAKKA